MKKHRPSASTEAEQPHSARRGDDQSRPQPPAERVVITHELTPATMRFLEQFLVPNAELNGKLDALLAAENQSKTREKRIMKELDDLRAEVQRGTTVGASVKALLKNLSDRIAAGSADPAELRQLVADIKANNDELVADVLANTPSEGEVQPEDGV